MLGQSGVGVGEGVGSGVGSGVGVGCSVVRTISSYSSSSTWGSREYWS